MTRNSLDFLEFLRGISSSGSTTTKKGQTNYMSCRIKSKAHFIYQVILLITFSLSHYIIKFSCYVYSTLTLNIFYVIWFQFLWFQENSQLKYYKEKKLSMLLDYTKLEVEKKVKRTVKQGFSFLWCLFCKIFCKIFIFSLRWVIISWSSSFIPSTLLKMSVLFWKHSIYALYSVSE